MRRCILHVTDHEFDEILQLNHDALVWDRHDRAVQEGLKTIVGPDVADQISEYAQCRMEKHNWLEGHARVEEDTAEGIPSPAFSG